MSLGILLWELGYLRLPHKGLDSQRLRFYIRHGVSERHY